MLQLSYFANRASILLMSHKPALMKWRSGALSNPVNLLHSAKYCSTSNFNVMENYNKTLPESPLEFGQSLRTYRKTAKLSQQKAADLLGISPRFLWNIEMGDAKLPAHGDILTKELAVEKLLKAVSDKQNESPLK
jgi:DNA-binding XRE family transcriptional regulator